MELANIAFHAETPGRFSVLGKYMRKIKLHEKVNNLFDENRGKQAMLRRYLSDVARQMDYTELEDIPNEFDIDEYVDTRDCAFGEPNSENISELRVSDNKILDMGYIHDSKDHSKSKHSSSSTLVSDGMVMDIVRECGDGTEVPDLADDKYSNDGSGSERVVIGAERCNLVEFKFSHRQTYSKRIIEGSEQIGTTKFRRVTSEEYANTAANQVGPSDTDASQLKTAKCECNTYAVTRKRQKCKTAGKLKGLLNLYKTMKMKKKLAKKCIAGNLTCLTPVKSSTGLNSAFIMDPTKLENVLSISGYTRSDLTSVGNHRLCSDTIDESTENVRVDSADSTLHVLNAAFISGCLTNSQNNGGNNSNNNNNGTDTLLQTQETFDDTDIQIEDQHNLANLGIQSKYLSFCHNTVNCSSRYDDFAYLNNGFVMD